ncbi:hypothetical protein COLO4_00093 [Corchorus olitorius]|uniref:Uncharacterized protein n=1 Tax=Corchorus olitorius TaxID=93759 RepID=A0A1R3L4Q4_9ROSI|nr:hypothetical protein COLO4_00093 [Corchorus olitorius]
MALGPYMNQLNIKAPPPSPIPTATGSRSASGDGGGALMLSWLIERPRAMEAFDQKQKRRRK